MQSLLILICFTLGASLKAEAKTTTQIYGNEALRLASALAHCTDELRLAMDGATEIASAESIKTGTSETFTIITQRSNPLQPTFPKYKFSITSTLNKSSYSYEYQCGTVEEAETSPDDAAEAIDLGSTRKQHAWSSRIREAVKRKHNSFSFLATDDETISNTLPPTPAYEKIIRDQVLSIGLAVGSMNSERLRIANPSDLKWRITFTVEKPVFLGSFDMNSSEWEAKMRAAYRNEKTTFQLSCSDSLVLPNSKHSPPPYKKLLEKELSKLGFALVTENIARTRISTNVSSLAQDWVVTFVTEKKD